MKVTPFYVGQKVICIDGSQWYDSTTGYPVNGPEQDKVYTISGFDDDYLKLNGFDQEDSFCPKYFRPLEQLKFPLMKYSKVMEEQLISEN